MKRWFGIGVCALAGVCLQAQEKPGAAPKPAIEVQTPLPPAKPTTASTNVLDLPKEPTVTFGGTVMDFKRSTNRWKMFSLRKPLDRKADEATVIRETRTEGARPVKLFSIDF
jgi:hypothetical protein